MSDESAELAAIRLRRYASGKVYAFTQGDARHVAAATRALQRSVVLEAKVDAARFIAMMQADGVPEDAAFAFLSRITLDDEAFLRDVPPI